ncbi:hypothetical protein INR49_023407 [Caranx melampygus]|nr:hypothetical protein INR49_023407 [Caranx melampygus]
MNDTIIIFKVPRQLGDQRASVNCGSVLHYQGVCYGLSRALPMAKTEDTSLEQDTFASLLSDEATETSLNDAEMAAVGKARGPRVIVVADPSLWRDLRVLHNGLPLFKRRADSNGQGPEHSQDQAIPILRRDNMRCMGAKLSLYKHIRKTKGTSH